MTPQFVFIPSPTADEARRKLVDLQNLARGYAGKLSLRELQVFVLACERLTSAQIAAKLSSSEKTIEAQTGAMRKKLGLASRRALVAAAALAVFAGLKVPGIEPAVALRSVAQ